MLPQSQLVRVFQIASGAAEFLALWWVQSTLVIAAGLTVAHILRHRGPALQSAIYRTTLVAALVCPLAAALLSAAGIGIPNVALPHIRAVGIDDVVVAIPQTRPDTPPPAPAATPPHKDIPPIAESSLPSRGEHRLPPELADDPRFDPRMLRDNRLSQPARSEVPSVQKPVAPPPAPKPVAPPPVVKPLPPLPPLLVHRSVWAVHWLPAIAVATALAIWLLGTLVFLTRLAISLARLLHLYGSARPVAEDGQQLCRELSKQIGVRPPRLLQSPFVTGPCLAGFLRATILLPEESVDLPLAAVLVHELAHLRRGDCRWNLIRQASLAVLFWQPLVWRLSRRMETVAEEVCDDHVVHWGSDRAVYASGLVRLAEQNTLPISTVVPLVTFRSLLGQRVQRILDSSRRLSLRTGVKAICAIAVAGLAITLLVGAFGSDRPNATASNSATAKTATAKTTTAAVEPKKIAGSKESAAPEKQFTGTVLLPDGKPAVGAQVFVVGLRQNGGQLDFNNAKWIVIRASRCDASGHFVIPKPDLVSLLHLFDANLLARSADGAIAWRAIDSDEFGAQRPVKLRAAVPLRGRLMKADGRPAAGIRLKLLGMQTVRTADSGRNDGANIGTAKLPSDFWPSDITADAGGWYSVPGIAPGVSAVLRFDQQPYAPQWVELDSTMPEAKRTTVLAPAQIVKGIVVAADTGKPLAGALVKVCEGSYLYVRALANEAKTDTQGRFNISPFAAKSYTVAAFGPGRSPYLAAAIHFDWARTEREHEVRIVLPRGVLVSGTIHDDATRAPVAGAIVTYIAHDSNPLAAEIPLSGTYPSSEPSDEHGRFSFAVPAGTGHLTVRASADYVLKRFDPTPLIGDKSNGELLPINSDAPLDLAADAHDATVNFTLHRGVTVAGQIVRTDGSRPMRVFMVHRGTEWLERDFRGGLTVTLAGGGFEIRGLPPEEETPVYLLDPDAKEGTIFFAGAAEAGRPQTVRLQKCGSLAMRYLDPTGKPVADYLPNLYMAFVPGTGEVTDVGNFDHVNCFWLATDDTGRITFPTLIPGVAYGLLDVDNKARDVAFSGVRRIVAKPGEHIELPDITIGNPQVLSIAKSNRGRLPLHYESPTERAARADVAANSESSLRIRGTVVDARGKPVAGARLFTVNGNSVQPPQGQSESLATTDGDGRFDFVAVSAAGRINDLIAAADGFELARVNADDFNSPASVLRLVPDALPLTGRIVSIEGQPVVGAKVAVCRLWPGWGQNLDAWESAATGQRSWYGQFIGLTGPWLEGPQIAMAIPPTTTDADGRFTMRGIGRERIVELLVSGRGIESKKIFACTRSGKKIVLDERFARDFAPERSGVFANGFTDVVGPSNAVVGRVTDLATGKPLAGVTVLSQALHGKRGDQDYIRTITDADGRYRLEGMPLSSHEQDRGRGDENEIGAYTLAEPYLPISKDVRVDLGPKPVTLNFQLPRGVWVEGRVSDKATGRPLAASVEYGAFWSNPLDKKLGDYWRVDLSEFCRTDSDGRFRVAALPGRGMVAVTVGHGYGVLHTVIGAEKIREVRRNDEMLRFQADAGGFASDYSAVAEINPAENTGIVTVDFKLPTATITGHVVNADGKPDDDAIVYDAEYVFPRWYRAWGGGLFYADGYDPAKPRRLVFCDTKLNQAAICVLSGPAPKSLVVRLQPAGSVRGRLVDQDGTPLGKVQLLRGHRSPEETRALSLADMPLPIPTNNFRNSSDLGPSTDDQGRFEIHGLIPGREYYVDLMQPGDRGVQGQFPKTFSARAGEIKDLGDIMPVRTPGLGAAREAALRIEAETVVAGAVTSDQNVARAETAAPAQRSTAAPRAKVDAMQPTVRTKLSTQASAMPAAKAPAGPVLADPFSKAGPLGAPAKPIDFVLTHVAGTVLAPDGKPAVGASVILSGYVANLPRHLPLGIQEPQLDDPADNGMPIIGRAQCDSAGHFEIAGPANVRYAFAIVLARAAGTGLAWQQIDAKNPGADCTIKLLKSAPVRLRFLGLEGKPIAGIHLTLTSIFRNPNTPEYSGVFRSPSFPADIWPSVVSDADGWLSIDGLAAGVQAEVSINQEPYAPEFWRLDPAGQKRKNQVRLLMPGTVIKGIVVAADSGKPLAGAAVLASEGDEFQTVGTARTDKQGRFRINSGMSGRLHIAAFGPTGGSYAPRQIAFDVRETEREHEARIELPRGVRINGTLVAAPDGGPIAGAGVIYYLDAGAPDGTDIHLPYGGPFDPTDDRYHPAEWTDEHGRFSMTVPIGRGKLGISAAEDYVRSDNAWGNIEVPLDFSAARETSLKIPLQRGVTIKGHVLRADGQPINQNWKGRPESASWPGHERALVRTAMNRDQFVITGFPPGGEMMAIFADGDQGKLFAIHASDAEKPVEIRLEPCGSLALTFVDRKGKPIEGLWPTLLQSFPPEEAGTVHWKTSNWYPPAGNESKQFPDGRTDSSGRFTFVNLIPGLAYGLWMPDMASKNPSAVKIQEIVVKPGERLELPPMTIRRPKEFSPGGLQPKKPASKTAASAEGNRLQATSSTATTQKTAAVTPAANTSDKALRIRGQVVDPSGKPVAAARLFTVRWTNGPPPDREMKPWGVTGSNGRFEFQLSQELKDSRLVATADGFGLAFGDVRDFDGSNVVGTIAAAFAGGGLRALHLVPDDKPLTGRIISIDGRPIAGAKIAVLEMWFNDQTNLDAWEKAAKDPKSDYNSVIRTVQRREAGGQPSQAVSAATTGADGRFTMHGIGRERLVRLLVSGPGIESKRIWTRTRSGEKIVVPRLRDRDEGEDYEFYANGFTLVAGPSNAIVGRVTDRATGKPLAGVTVLSQKLQGNPISGWGQDFIHTVTDADGRYRIEGMPLGNENALGAFVLDEPYLPTSRDVRVNIGPQPITLNFRMPRGVWIEGRVTDRNTGKPVQGTIQYFAFGSNPFLKTIGRPGDVDLRFYQRSGADGRFRVAALPGRGIIGVMADDFQMYSGRSAGAEKIEGGDRHTGALTFRTEPYYCAADNFTALAEVNPSEGTERVDLDFRLDSGIKLIGNVVDADGKPLFGATYCGDEPAFEVWRFATKDSFTVNSYDPSKPRRLIFCDLNRNLAAVYVLSGQPPKQLVVHLEPAGTVRGRVVDAHGRPMARVQLLCPAPRSEGADGSSSDGIRLPLLKSEMERGYNGPATDDDGRFEVHGLVPGHQYRVAIYEPAKNRLVVEFPKAFSVRPGEAKDLGDVKVVDESENGVAVNNESPASSKQPAAKGSKPTTSNDSAADRVTIRGRVVDPQGKPVAGATVGAWFSANTFKGPLETKTDSTGRFTFECRRAKPTDSLPPRHFTAALFATAGEQFGPAWIECDLANPGDVALQLPVVEPIEGRIVDLEGKPIVAAVVKAQAVDTNGANDLTAWLDALKRSTPLRAAREYAGGGGFSPARQAKTDSDGRFHFSGFARDRRVEIAVIAPGFVPTTLTIINRPMAPIRVDTSLPEFYAPRTSELYYGSHFQAAIEPAQSIEGTIRDAKTSEPIAGIKVLARNRTGQESKSVSDQHGRYRLDGLISGDDNRVSILPRGDQPYFGRELPAPKTHGVQTIKLDVAIHRGVLIHVRLTDRETGKPVSNAEIAYVPWSDNPKLAETPELTGKQNPFEPQRTDSAGRFTLVGLPGRGLVEVQNSFDRPYPVGQGLRDIPDLPNQEVAMTLFGVRAPGPWTTAIREIRIGEGDKETSCEIQLQPAKPLVVHVTDSQGQPLRGIGIEGTMPNFSGAIDIAGPDAQILGLGPDEQRTVLFHQKERNLAKAAIFSWKKNGPGPITIALEPCATVKLRLLGSHGEPLRGIQISFSQLQKASTDGDGRLAYAALAPRYDYGISWYSTIGAFHSLVGKFNFAPGQVVDLGDIDATTGKRMQDGEKSAAASNKRKPANGVGKNDTGRVRIRGRVVDPSGKPVAGADVSLISGYYHIVFQPVRLAAAKSDSMGRFELSVEKKKAAESATLVAISPAGSFGADWRNFDSIKSDEVVTLRLTPDVPIDGRVTSLEGKPIAGATVQVEFVVTSKDNDLSPWLARIRQGVGPDANSFDGLDRFLSGLTVKQWQTTAGPDGRFHLSGIGRERVASLRVLAPGFVPTLVRAATRPMQPIKAARPKSDYVANSWDDFYYGSTPRITLEPAQPIEGTIRDEKSGEPLAGVRIYNEQFAGVEISAIYGDLPLTTISDARGHYRLDGMPHGKGNKLVAFPADGQAYLARDFDVPTAPGLTPIKFDIRLLRGVSIHGRVSDKTSGKPIAGARMMYVPWPTNPNIRGVADFNRGYLPGSQDQFLTDGDGRYALVGLPGRGVVEVDMQRPAPKGQGLAAIKDLPAMNVFMKVAGALAPNWGGLTAYKDIRIEDPEQSATADFQTDLGKTITINVVDPDGKPVKGIDADGVAPLGFYGRRENVGPMIEIGALAPNEHRSVLLFQKSRNLGKAINVCWKTDGPGPITVKLEPCATLRARLLDNNRSPVRNARISIAESNGETSLPAAQTDADGRFIYAGLIPGAACDIKCDSRQVGQERNVAEKLAVAAGQTIDLGEINVMAEKPPAKMMPAAMPKKSSPARIAVANKTAGHIVKGDADERMRLRGRVVDPNGKPVAGADVRGMLFVHEPRGGSWHDATPPMEAKSDSAGRFTLECRKSELAPDESNFPISIVVAASLPDNRFGPEWVDYDPRKPHDLTLQLVPDEPIEGRIIDLEGKPVAGAEVSAWISKNSENDLSKWLAALKLGMPLRQSEAAGSPDDTCRTLDRFETKTDSAGRFKLVGIGRERLARITVSARGFVSGDFSVVTRPMDRIKADEFGHGSVGLLANRTEFIYGSRFTGVLDPEQTIEGYVRDATTGQPIAGVNLSGFGKSDYMVGPENRDRSDAEGHYRIHALHAGDEYELMAETPRQPYLSERVDAPKAHGLGTIKFDLVLHRGVPIQGRITDKQTGRPVQDAEVQYVPSRKNPHFIELRNQGVMFRERSQAMTDDDGRFTLTGIPGPGLIEVSEFNQQFSQIRSWRRSRRGLAKAAKPAENSYPLGQGFSEIANLSDFAPRPQPDALAVKEIRIGEKETEAKCEIQLQPAKPLELKLVDPQGHPLDGVEVCGAGEASRFFNVQGSAGATTKVLGLGPDEQRTLVFRQPERKLGRVVVVSWKKFGAGPATITLEPCATIKLRLVDAAHQPQRGSRVDFIPTSDNETRDTAFFQSAPTDADGRLVYSTLAPGETYTVASQQDGIFGDDLLIDKLAVEPGKTIDLGELNVSIANRRTMRQMKMAPKAAPVAKQSAQAKSAADKSNKSAADSTPRGATQTNRKPPATAVASKPDDNVPTRGIPSARLANDGGSIEPIEGRIVDLQGRPIAGVEVQITAVTKNDRGDLTNWLKEIKGGLPVSGSDSYGNPKIRCELEFDDRVTVKTNADGRFQINAIGHDHVAYLNFFGGGIVPAYITVVARPIAPIKVLTWPWVRNRETYYGSKFEFAAEPSQPVEGIVRDAKSGKPVAGVRVDVAQIAGNRGVNYYYAKKVYAWTDARGHYLLDGLPKGTGNRIKLVPPQDSRYFGRELDVPTAAGFQLVKFDIELHAGVLIRGKLTNKANGEPIGGAQIYYSPAADNPNFAGLPEFKPLFFEDPNRRGTAYNDGQFMVKGLPGRGLIIARPAPEGVPTFESTVLAAFPPGQGEFKKLSSERRPGPFDPTIIQKIQVPDSATETSVKVAVDPGHSLTLKFVDPDGNPLLGVEMNGYYPYDGSGGIDSGGTDGTVLGLSDYEDREILLQQKKRKLGEAILLNWKKDGPGPITVKLEPSATIKARFVDNHSQPIRGETLLLESERGDNHQRLDQLQTGADGCIVYKGIVPGTTYRITDFGRPFIEGISVSPGATIDLGEVDVTAQKPAAKMMPAPAPKKSAPAPKPIVKKTAGQFPKSDADELMHVRGRVVDPQGKLVAGAEVYVVQAYRQLSPRETRIASTKSGADGRFDLEFRKSQFVPYRIEPWRFAVVAAFAPDRKFGPAWKNYVSIADRENVMLQLVPDEPIEGQIIDLEGKPIAGVDAKVALLTSDVQSDVSSEEISSKSAIPFAGSQGFEEPDRFLSVRFVEDWQARTDSDGRFHISGVGRDRVAHIDISGAEIVPAELRVVARSMQAIKEGDPRRFQIPESRFIYGSSFRFAAEPSQPIEGVVRDAATGKPLAGVRVLASQLAGAAGSVAYWTMKIGAVSDEAGRYRLDGMPKGPGNRIMAMPADGQPYFMRAFNVPAAPEFQSVKFDLNLHRGRLIHGRVTDATGKPVAGARMEYFAWPTNPAIKGMPEFDYGWVGVSSERYQTDQDGKYTLVGLPGRGCVEVGYCPQPFSTGQGLKEITDLPSERELEKVTGRPPDQHYPTAIKNLQIGDGDDAVNVDFALDRGKRITLKLVDPDGKPVSGVRIDGFDPNIDLATREDAGPTADVVGLGPDEKRLVLLYQKERNLGKAMLVSWKDNGPAPLTVKLEPCATLRARVLNELHEPVRDGYVIFSAQHGAFRLMLPFGKTDDDGRLNYTTLLPGGSYRVICVAPDFHESLVEGELTAAPGEVIDLGEFDGTAKFRPKIIRTIMADSEKHAAVAK